MDWMKKNIEMVTIISTFAISVLWMNGRFNEIEKDLTIVKTVLIMRNLMPSDLAIQEK